METQKLVHIDERDNSVITLVELQEGDTVTLPDGESITVKEHIPPSHKIAMHSLKAGDPIIKYGEEIGIAACDIPRGGWIHAHNISESQAFEQSVRDSLKGGSSK
jgi:hypothetical protein